MAPSPGEKNSGLINSRWRTCIDFLKEGFERERKENESLLDIIDELIEMRATDQRLASLEQDARQPRLAMEADGPAGEKTRGRTEGAAKADQAMHGDSCSANRVDPDPMCSTSFGGDFTGPPALSCSRDGALVDNGTAAPKSCLSPFEMIIPTAVGGLLPTGETFTATSTTFDLSTLWFCQTEETILRTSTSSA